jgi:hypothetical protein
MRVLLERNGLIIITTQGHFNLAIIGKGLGKIIYTKDWVTGSWFCPFQNAATKVLIDKLYGIFHVLHLPITEKGKF